MTPDHGRIHAKLPAPASAAKATASSAIRAHRARRAMRLAAKGRPVVNERAGCYLAKWCCLLPLVLCSSSAAYTARPPADPGLAIRASAAYTARSRRPADVRWLPRRQPPPPPRAPGTPGQGQAAPPPGHPGPPTSRALAQRSANTPAACHRVRMRLELRTPGTGTARS